MTRKTPKKPSAPALNVGHGFRLADKATRSSAKPWWELPTRIVTTRQVRPRTATLFKKYAETPELAHLLNAIVFQLSLRNQIAPTSRVFFIPDLIKVDLSTGPCRLAGGGTNDMADPDDTGFSRLGIFGGDVLTSTVQAGFGNGMECPAKAGPMGGVLATT